MTNGWDTRSWIVGLGGSLLLAGLKQPVMKYTGAPGDTLSAIAMTAWVASWACILPIYLAWSARRYSFIWALIPGSVGFLSLNSGSHNTIGSTLHTIGIFGILGTFMWALGMALRRPKRSILQPQPETADENDPTVWPPAPKI